MIVGRIPPHFIEAVYVRDGGALDIVRPIVKEHWKPDGVLRVDRPLHDAAMRQSVWRRSAKSQSARRRYASGVGSIVQRF